VPRPGVQQIPFRFHAIGGKIAALPWRAGQGAASGGYFRGAGR